MAHGNSHAGTHQDHAEARRSRSAGQGDRERACQPRLQRCQRGAAGQVHRGRSGRDRTRRGRAFRSRRSARTCSPTPSSRTTRTSWWNDTDRAPMLTRPRRRGLLATAASTVAMVLCEAAPPRRRRPPPRRSPTSSTATRSPCRPDAGTRKGRARSTPSARLIFDPERSAQVSSATRAGDGGERRDRGRRCRQVRLAELAQAYGEATFRDELPEAICGESDKAPRQDRQRQADDPGEPA